MVRFLAGTVLAVALLGAAPSQRFEEAFPAWRYVLWEFDIDASFIEEAHFERYALRHRRRMTNFYKEILRKRGYLVRLIRGELLDEDMSDIFVYMSMVESALRCDALSEKDAAGIWQFIPATARRYKLVCNADEDQRRDPVAATKAAVGYLDDLHRRFGKWYLAVLAYNCGEGRVTRALRRLGDEEASALVSERSPLPRETRRYLKEVLLLAMVAESETIAVVDDGREDNICEGRKTTGTLSFYRWRRGDTLSSVAARFGWNKTTLRRLNPELPGDPSEGTLLIVPGVGRPVKQK